MRNDSKYFAEKEFLDYWHTAPFEHILHGAATYEFYGITAR
jgi:hypothetical protein